MTQNSLIIPAAVVAISLVACITDVRTRRIPNVLTFSAALSGFLFHGLSGGPEAALIATSGWIVGLLLFAPFFLLGGMGGGDVKLLAALGAWLGPRDTLWLAAYSALAGGALGAAVAYARGYLGTALWNVFAILSYWRTAGLRPVPNFTLESANTPRLAYAIPILAGTVITLWQ